MYYVRVLLDSKAEQSVMWRKWFGKKRKFLGTFASNQRCRVLAEALVISAHAPHVGIDLCAHTMSQIVLHV